MVFQEVVRAIDDDFLFKKSSPVVPALGKWKPALQPVLGGEPSFALAGQHQQPFGTLFGPVG
jgi:hypothetical protein